MMYLSHVENSDYIIAVELDDNFLNFIKEIKHKILETKLDIDLVRLNFDKSKARLIEKGFYPYEDRGIHLIKNGEDPLDYYGYHVDKYYFPLKQEGILESDTITQEYWDDHEKPDIVYLEMYGDSFGFSAVIRFKKYEGSALILSDWERMLA